LDFLSIRFPRSGRLNGGTTRAPTIPAIGRSEFPIFLQDDVLAGVQGS